MMFIDGISVTLRLRCVLASADLHGHTLSGSQRDRAVILEPVMLFIKSNILCLNRILGI